MNKASTERLARSDERLCVHSLDKVTIPRVAIQIKMAHREQVETLRGTQAKGEQQ